MKLIDKIQYLNNEEQTLKRTIRHLEHLVNKHYASERIDDAIMYLGISLEKVQYERDELKKGLTV